MSVLSVMLAATYALMNPVDWEPGRFCLVSNGLFSVTGHGGQSQCRATRERYAVGDKTPVVFEAETFQPPDCDGRHSADFWFECYGTDGTLLKTRVDNIADTRFSEGPDGWRRVRLELKHAPKGTAAVRVGSSCGASKYGKTPHTYLRNMRLSGVGELPDRPGSKSVAVSGKDVRIVCSSARTVWRLRFAAACPFTFSLAKTKTGYRIEPLGLDYRIGNPSNVVFAVHSSGARTQFYLDDNYIGRFDGLGRLTAVTDLVDSEGAVVLQEPLTSVAPNCDYVNFGAFDLGLATKKNEGLSSFKALTNSCVRTVPCEQYVRAYVTCAAVDDPVKDRAFTLRLSRYNDFPGRHGRAFNGMAQTLVELDTAKKTRAGETTLGGKTVPLWRVEVPLKLGQIPDIVFTDRIGTHLRDFSHAGLGRYLDLELLGRCIAVRGVRYDERMKRDATRTSAVTVYGVELEKPGCELDFRQTVPGNVFEPDENPVMVAMLRVKRPGNYQLAWTVKDAEDQVVAREERSVNATIELPVDFSALGLGWFSVDFTLSDGARTLLTHAASFARLPADTRRAAMGEEPYETWDYGGGHYTCVDPSIIGPLLRKAGFRRSFGFQNNPVEVRRPYKVSPVIVLGNGGTEGKTDEQLAAIVSKKLKDDPNVKSCMIGHESMPWVYRMAPEMTGQKYDEKMVMGEFDKYEWATNRIALAKSAARRIRRLFPDLYITVGNSVGSTEYIAALLRNGFPHGDADYMGLEIVGRTNLPERQHEASLQTADLMRETAKAFNCPWGVNGCFEQNYRNALLLGYDRQAAWYVRDLLLQQCWRFRDINIAILADVGNDYANGFWGTTGLMTRNPYHYPKKSYVAVATATHVLDQVLSAKSLLTGDPCVYVVEYVLRGDRVAYAVWTTRGTAEVSFTATENLAACDMYGRPFEPQGQFGNFFRCAKRFSFTATEHAAYLTGAAPCVSDIRVGSARTFPGEGTPAGACVVAKLDGSETMALKESVEPLMERTTGVFMPYRTKGKYELRRVVDEAEGPCLELELTGPDATLPVMFGEYAVAEFSTPIALADDPKSIGMKVKGNSGWGQVHWVLEDANGIRRISCGARGLNADCFDYDGRVSMSYTGWNFVSMPICQQSSIYDLSTGWVAHQWESGRREKDGKFKYMDGDPRYPIKLVGVAFCAQNRPLFLTERRPWRQVIRFKDVTVFDFK